MQDTQKLIGISALLCSVFFGSAVNPIFVRMATTTLSNSSYAFLRSFLTLLALLPIVYLHRQQLLTTKAIKNAVGLSLGFGLNIFLFALGVNLTTVAISQLLFALLPVTVSIAAFFLLKEKMNVAKIVAIVLGLTGVLVVSSSSLMGSNPSFGSPLGIFYIGLAVCVYTLFLVFSKKSAAEYQSLPRTVMTYAFVPVLFFPLSAPELVSQPITQMFSTTSVIGLIGIVVSSLIFILTLQIGIKHSSAGTVAMSSLLAPIFGSLAGLLFYAEPISGRLVISMILILTSVYIHLYQPSVSQLIPSWQKINQ